MNPSSSIKTQKDSQPSESQHNENLLAVPQIFTYEYFQTHRYQISDKDGYQCLCNNGFIKFYTLKTRVYWHAQNEFQHRVPDWKFHVSVQHEDLRKAWNLIVGLFIKMKCRAGMKTIYLKQAVNPQIGREITIYIVKYSKQFENSSFAGEYEISFADEHSEDFWLEMAVEIQRILTAHGIRANGLAEGDFKLGKYISLRNQAFVLWEDGNYIYPPNSEGWNPLNHKLPIDAKKLIKLLQTEEDQTKARLLKRNKTLYYFSLPIIIVSFGYLWMKQIKKF